MLALLINIRDLLAESLRQARLTGSGPFDRAGKGHLPAILDLEPQRAGGITRRAEAQQRTAQHIANHESPRTTMLYDRRQEEISLDEVERIVI